MTVHVDAIGNCAVSGPALTQESPRLLIGSHLDTVPNAGAFDGILGVVLGVALVEELQGQHLPFAIEVIGFSEEEGVRFSKPFLGSLALVGKLDAETLALTDRSGISVAEAIQAFGLDPAQLPAAVLANDTFAYLEFHIEQGPVLESEDTSLGIVDAISRTNPHGTHLHRTGQPRRHHSDAPSPRRPGRSSRMDRSVEDYAAHTTVSSQQSAKLKPTPAPGTSSPGTYQLRSTSVTPTTIFAKPPSTRC